jgi:hypothetical protein
MPTDKIRYSVVMGWEYVARCAPLDVGVREAVIDRVGQLPQLRIVERRPGEASFVWAGDRPANAWVEDGQICVQTVIPDAVYVLFHTGVAPGVMDQMWQAIHELTGAAAFDEA